MYPDGSVSFGGHFAFEDRVDTQARTGAIDPHTKAVISLARGRNRFAHKSAMLALGVHGTHQGTLDPEGGDVVGALEDFADRSLERYGVYPNRVFCSRPTAHRLLGSVGGLDKGSVWLRGGGISITALPLENDVLHMMDPLDRLLYTDGGMALGYTPTRTGYDLAIRGYQEFAVTGPSLAGAGSAATWTIPPRAEGDAGIPDQEGATVRPGRAPRADPPGATPDAVPLRKMLPLTEAAGGWVSLSAVGAHPPVEAGGHLVRLECLGRSPEPL